jgi:hypothetical protein
MVQVYAPLPELQYESLYYVSDIFNYDSIHLSFLITIYNDMEFNPISRIGGECCHLNYKDKDWSFYQEILLACILTDSLNIIPHLPSLLAGWSCWFTALISSLLGLPATFCSQQGSLCHYPYVRQAGYPSIYSSRCWSADRQAAASSWAKYSNAFELVYKPLLNIEIGLVVVSQQKEAESFPSG